MRAKLLIVLLFFFSCTFNRYYQKIPEAYQKKITHRFNANAYLNLKKYIQTDGYYEVHRYINENSDSAKAYIIFYENGLCALFFSMKDIDSFNNLNSRFSGIYNMRNDTLIVQLLYQPGSLNDWWELSESYFEIINSSTIKLVRNIPVLSSSNLKDLLVTYEKNVQERSLYQFHQISNKPKYNSWLLREQWLWENKSDWENYMRSKK